MTKRTNFKTCRWKNVLSYGNTWTEVQLNRSPSTLITGKNGAGKSAMYEALYFCLFGVPIRKVKKGELISFKNKKGLLVEVEFDVGSDQYKVVRGMKPDVFEIWKNGEELNKDATARAQQTMLNRDILRVDKTSFQIISLVSKTSDMQMFMSLKAEDRRRFVESILKVTVFAEMTKLHKANVAKLNAKVSEVATKITRSSTTVENKREEIVNATEALANYKKDRTDKLKRELVAHVAEHDALRAKKGAVAQKADYDADMHKALKKKHEAMTSMVAELRSDHMVQSRFLDAVKAGQCSKCLQTVDEKYVEAHRAPFIAKIAEIEAMRDKAVEKLKSLTEAVEALDNTQYENAMIDRAMETITRDIERVERSIAATVEELDSDEEPPNKIASLKEALKQEERALEGLEEERNALGVDVEYAKLMSTMLSDSGAKSVIVKKFLPIINTAINDNLSKLGFHAKFTLDETFKESIKYRGFEDLSFDSFSEGEKLRINIAILLAWQDVAAMQGMMDSNLMLWDEKLDGSLDTEGYEALIDVFKAIEDRNVFVISHNPTQLENYVRSKMNIERVDGFSVISAAAN